MSVTNRIDSVMRTIQNLRPQGFTLDKLDEELASMAMIRSLPDDYSSFVSSLLLMDKLEKSAIHQAFHTEETQRRCRAEIEQISFDKALSTVPQTSTTLHCDFCDRPGSKFLSDPSESIKRWAMDMRDWVISCIQQRNLCCTELPVQSEVWSELENT